MDDDLSVVRQRLENEKIAAEIKLLNCNVKAAGAQAEKVQLEIHQLKSDSGWAANFGKKVWPVLSSAVTLAISLIALTVSLFTNARQTEDQHRQERDKLLSENLAAATAQTSTAARRMAAIWAMTPLWDDDSHDVVLASSLASILVTETDPHVRGAAAESLGAAITETTPRELAVKRAKLFYGSSKDWAVGTVILAHWTLLREPESEERNGKLAATREAIRRNWENLENTHLAGVSLSGSKLYEARLRGAFLARADLVNTDLKGADLRVADLSGADLSGANVDKADLSGAT